MAFSTQARHEQLIHSYIDAHGYASILVDNDPVRVSVSKAYDWKRKAVATYWHADLDTLLRLSTKVGPIVDADDAQRRIRVIAERNNIRLTPHNVMLGRARGAVDLIERRLREMQERGDMKRLNTEYQNYRLRMKETGRNALPYQSWRAR